MWGQAPTINKDYQTSIEYKKLAEAKPFISKGIVEKFNTSSLKHVGANIKKYLYDDDESPVELARIVNVWKVAIIGDKRTTPNHFECIIHNGELDMIGQCKLSFFVVPNGTNERGFVSYRAVDKDTYQNICKKYVADHAQDTTGQFAEYRLTVHNCRQFINNIKQELEKAYSSGKDVIGTFEKLISSHAVTRRIAINVPWTYDSFGKHDFEEDIYKFVSYVNCKAEDEIKFKDYIITVLTKVYTNECCRIVRFSIKKQFDDKGVAYIDELPEVTDESIIDIDMLYSLLQYNNDRYSQIIERCFVNNDPKKLENQIKSMLKLYHAFKKSTELDIEAIARETGLTPEKILHIIETSGRDRETFRRGGPGGGGGSYHKKEAKPTEDIHKQKIVYLSHNVDRGTIPDAVYGNELYDHMKITREMYNKKYSKDQRALIEDIIMLNSNESFIFIFVIKKPEDAVIDGRSLGDFTAIHNSTHKETLRLSYAKRDADKPAFGELLGFLNEAVRYYNGITETMEISREATSIIETLLFNYRLMIKELEEVSGLKEGSVELETGSNTNFSKEKIEDLIESIRNFNYVSEARKEKINQGAFKEFNSLRKEFIELSENLLKLL